MTTSVPVVGVMQEAWHVLHIAACASTALHDLKVQSDHLLRAWLQERWLDPLAPHCPVDADSAHHQPPQPVASPASSPGLWGRAGADKPSQSPKVLLRASPELQQPVGTPKASPPVSPGGGAPKRFLAFSTGPRQVQHMWHGICWHVFSGKGGACSCAPSAWHRRRTDAQSQSRGRLAKVAVTLHDSSGRSDSA